MACTETLQAEMHPEGWQNSRSTWVRILGIRCTLYSLGHRNVDADRPASGQAARPGPGGDVSALSSLIS